MSDFIFDGVSTGFTDDDFGKWALGDLLSNVTRGILAEYLVAKALGIEDNERINWNAYDLMYGKFAIEVKSSAYIQSWNSDKYSRISFSIGRRVGWYADTNTVGQLKRHAELYVFCVLAGQDRSTVNPLNLDQWVFYVVLTDDMDEKIPNQKTIGLNSLVSLFELKPLRYNELKLAIDKLIAKS